MAKFFGATKLTGGTTGALDDILHTELTDGDGAIVIDAVNNKTYKYTYESSNSDSESSPNIINPDSNSGNGRWVLVEVVASQITVATGATVDEFSTDGTLTGDSNTAIPTEKAVKTYVDSQISSVLAPSDLAGYVHRPKFTYKDTDEIYVYPGKYHVVNNTLSHLMLYWSSTITYQFGSGGSNATSDDLGASQWQFLYIDYSALSGSVLTAARLYNSTTPPIFVGAKNAWYNSAAPKADDRCIGMFRTNGDSEVVSFKHDGGDFLRYDDPIQDVTSETVTFSWEDHTLTIPVVCSRAEATFIATNGTDQTRYLYYRTTGDSGDGHIVGKTYNSTSSYSVNTLSVYTNSSLSIDLYATGPVTVDIYTNGYYFPRGI